MVSSLHDCPTPEDFSGYLAGSISPQQAQEIEQHLSECSQCDETISRVESRTETLADLLREVVPEDPYQREPGFTATGDRLFQLQETFTSDRTEAASLVVPSLLGHYQVGQKLGQGGMGAVYEAVHLKLNKTVAIKVLPAHRNQSPQAVARFQREMQALGELDHPHLVQATDAGECEGISYLVMERLVGKTLSAVLSQTGSLDMANACEIARQTALGLHAAYEIGLIHRDIKPSNLMLAEPSPNYPSAHVKILDLGLARWTESQKERDDLTAEGDLVGTLSYMAPEQGLDALNADIRADLYSLGATLYRLLAGKPTFPGDQYPTRMTQLVALANEPPESLDRCCPQLPPELVSLVHRFLDKDPERRPQTPIEAAEALSPFCAGHDLKGLLDSESPQQNRPANRQPHADRVETNKSPGTGTPRRHRSVVVSFTALIGLGLMGWFIWPPAENDSASSVAVPETSLQPALSQPAGELINPDRRAIAWVNQIGGKVEAVTNGSVRRIRSHEELKPTEVLHLAFTEETRLTNEGLQNLKGATLIRSIIIRGPKFRLNHEGLEILANLKKLHTFRLFDVPFDDRGLEILAKNTALWNLQCCSSSEPNQITDRGLQHLKTLPHLNTLAIQSPHLTDDGLATLDTLTDLQYLTLRVPQMTDAGLVHLQQLKKLRVLLLQGCQFIRGLSAHLQHHPHLERLSLTYLANLDEQGLAESISRLPKLYQLTFMQLPLREKTLKQLLSSLSHETPWRIHLQDMTNLQAETLAALPPSIVDLSVVANRQLTDHIVEQLLALDNLKRLDVRTTGLSKAGVARLIREKPDCLVISDFSQELPTETPGNPVQSSVPIP